MSGSLSRRQLLRAAVPVCAGLAGSVVGAAAMFGATDDSDKPEPVRRTSVEVPSTMEAAVIPTTSSVLLTYTRPTLNPALEPTAQAHPAVRSLSIVRGGIADLVASRDSEGRVVEQHDPGWIVPLEAVVVDPATHAEFVSKTDSATLAALGDGQVLLSRTSAALRRVSVGGTLELAGGIQLVVAGIVEDATIGAAELVMTTSTGAAAGLDAPRYMLVTYDGDRGELEAAFRAVLPVDVDGTVKVRFRAPGEAQFLRQGEAVLPPTQLKERFGEFSLNRDRPGGDDVDFLQSSEWINQNLVSIDLPIITTLTGKGATCHRLVVDAVVGALNELVTLNLAGLIDPDPEAYQGAYNPRFVRDNPYDISRHSWGVAFDINYKGNVTGTEPIQDERLIEVFRRWGFTEGSNWLRADAGHFEYVGLH